jgi:hypothetical protein
MSASAGCGHCAPRLRLRRWRGFRRKGCRSPPINASPESGTTCRLGVTVFGISLSFTGRMAKKPSLKSGTISNAGFEHLDCWPICRARREGMTLFIPALESPWPKGYFIKLLRSFFIVASPTFKVTDIFVNEAKIANTSVVVKKLN